MEILSDTTFRGATTFQKTVSVVGNLSAGSLCLSSDYIRAFCSSTNSTNNYWLRGGGTVAIVGCSSTVASSFTNKTIPSGCKKFTMGYNDLVSFGDFNFDSAKPHIIQIRKTSTGETMDMLVNITGSRSTVGSEFTFERGSTDEIPQNYFRTTVVGYLS